MAQVLILGSMPGAASLAAGQYYAHPRNLFWPIMGELIGAGPERPYALRLQLLQRHGIALWDVFESCLRPGSLDADIAEARTNDFASFFAEHPSIARVFCNGATAYDNFRRRVLPTLRQADALVCVRLPSTSPANAGLPRADKLAAWRRVIEANATCG